MSSLDPSSPVETPLETPPAVGSTTPPARRTATRTRSTAGVAKKPATAKAATAPRAPRAAKPAPVPRARSASAVPASELTVPADPALDLVPSPRSADLPPAPAVAEIEPVEAPGTPEAGSAPASDAGEVLRSGRHRRPSRFQRRPALLIAGALALTLGTGLIATGNAPSAGASTGSQSVSVAAKLGLTSAKRELSAPVATARLKELAASRATREAAQTAAVQAQAAADTAAAAAAAEAARPKAVLPAQGCAFTSGFGARWGTLHAGIDLAGPIGTPEYAAMDGVVLKAGPASGFGQAVYIQHANGDVTVYGHMEKILVTAGQVVKAGDTIALMGAEGEATGPHLHFEVHVGGIQGQKIDPVPWLAARGVQV